MKRQAKNKKVTVPDVKTLKQAVLYYRVSTKLQSDRESLPVQRERLYNWCREKKVEIIGDYYDDGISGKSIEKRVKFKEMMDKLQKGTIVLVPDLSRFSRNNLDFHNAIAQIHDKGCVFVCLNPEINSADKSGRLILGVLSTLAEHERETIAERTKIVMQSMSRRGLLLTRPPYGYKKDHETGKYIEDPAMMAVVRKILALNEEGVNLSRIAAILNMDGDGKTLGKDDGIFYPQSIKRIIHYHTEGSLPEKVKNWNEAMDVRRVKREARQAEKKKEQVVVVEEEEEEEEDNEEYDFYYSSASKIAIKMHKENKSLEQILDHLNSNDQWTSNILGQGKKFCQDDIKEMLKD